MTDKSVQVIALTSGKGGVGKSNAAVKISIDFEKESNHVLLLAADLGLENVDVMIGSYDKTHLIHALNSKKGDRERIL